MSHFAGFYFYFEKKMYANGDSAQITFISQYNINRQIFKYSYLYRVTQVFIIACPKSWNFMLAANIR